MNNLILGSSAESEQKTMSSKEIAMLTGKEHSNVLRDIRVMIEELKKGDSNLNSESYQGLTDEKGNPNLDSDYKVIKLTNGMTGEILLNEELSLCLAAGYSIILRMKIIKRWKELEQSFKIPQTLGQALQLAADQALLIEQKEALLLEQAPKIKAFENVIDATTSYTLDSVSDLLDIGRTTLSKMLEAKKWKTVRDTNGTSSTRYAEENGYAKTVFEWVTAGKKEIKVKKIVLRKKGVDKLIKELNK